MESLSRVAIGKRPVAALVRLALVAAAIGAVGIANLSRLDARADDFGGISKALTGSSVEKLHPVAAGHAASAVAAQAIARARAVPRAGSPASDSDKPAAPAKPAGAPHDDRKEF